MKNTFDTIVLGLGAMGSASVYQLAKRGKNVLGIDQFSPPHIFGSSHGDTRITRQAIGEGDLYTPLSLRAYEIWEELEKASGKKLLEKCGGLIISSGSDATKHTPHFFSNTIAAAEKFRIQHEVLTADDIRKRFPPFQVQDHERGYYEPGAGFLRPEECINAQLTLAEKYGATIRKNETVTSFLEKEGGVYVKTNLGEYAAEKLIITAGSWLPTLLEEKYRSPFRTFRQVLFWFDLKGPVKRFTPPSFPVFIWQLPSKQQSIYGFPAVDGQHGGIKIATEQYETITTADTVNREVSQDEAQLMFERFVEPYFPDLSRKCLRTASCLYTVTPDSHFVIDTHPKHSSVIVASPCSGHGFKYSAAIGEVLSQLALTGQSQMDISSFSFRRLSDLEPKNPMSTFDSQPSDGNG